MMESKETAQRYLKAAVQARPPSGACLDEEQVVAFYSGQMTEVEMEAIRDHLAECPQCLALAREARQFLRAMSEPVQVGTDLSLSPPAPWHRRHRRELFLLAAMVIIAVGVTWWRGWRAEAPSEPIAQTPPPPITTPRPNENPWRDLDIAKAEYTPAITPTDDLIWRDDGLETPSAPKLSPFARAMRPYERNDFAGAERRLGQFLEKNPKQAEAHFYRGVSLLLLDKTADAVTPLETAIEHGDAWVREEAQWYLAQAYLKLGEPSNALPHLDVVIEGSEKHRSEALPLRQQVREVLRQ